MRLKKKTKKYVEHLSGSVGGIQVYIWQYPREVYLEVDNKIVVLNRKQLKSFLNRKSSP